MSSSASKTSASRSQPHSETQFHQAISMAKTGAVWRYLFGYLERHRYGWLLALVSLFLAIFISLLGLGLFTPLIDEALPLAQDAATQAEGLRLIRILLLEMVGIFILGNLLFYRTYSLMTQLAKAMIVNLRADYYSKLMRQQPEFYHKYGNSHLVSVGMNDVEVIGTFFAQEAPSLFNLIGQLLLTTIFMLILSWRLGIGSILFASLVYLLGNSTIVPRVRRLATHYSQLFAATIATLNEDVAGVKDIQMFDQVRRTTREFRAELEHLGQTLTRMLDLMHLNGALVHTVSFLGLVLIYGLGTLGVLRGILSIGLLISFAAYFNQFIQPLRHLSASLVKVQAMLVAAQRVAELTSARSTIKEKPNAIQPPKFKGHIRFEGVNFSFAPNDPTAWRLKNINLEILPGEKVAFVGGSGTGKSALLSLIARFYDPTSGRVLIDGYDLRDLTVEGLRQDISWVAQNVVLFHDTLANNIRFAKPDASMDAVKIAARLAHVSEFVKSLDQGYETMLEETGHDLSGGQKQRVSLARAILSSPTILIMDEPTSALDQETERTVMQALDNFCQGRVTTLIITHRLSIIRNADKIVVLDQAEPGVSTIRDVGSHDQLIESSPEYMALLGRLRQKAILMPVDPLYNALAALPTVLGLAQAYNAPVHVLDFGPLETDDGVIAEQKHFGVTAITANANPLSLNVKHELRVNQVLNTLRREGIVAEQIKPSRRDTTWVEATLEAIERTQATHLVAVDNVLIPMETLRESIRRIERRSAVEYILINPVAEQL
jgi:ABC-type multidrug transport system fused ATPase/permease subunit